MFITVSTKPITASYTELFQSVFTSGGKVKVKLSLGLTKYHAMKTYLYLTKHHVMKTHGVVEIRLHEFLTSAPNGDE
jgi:hypothetical protein